MVDEALALPLYAWTFEEDRVYFRRFARVQNYFGGVSHMKSNTVSPDTKRGITVSFPLVV